jgi:hypothetical protein
MGIFNYLNRRRAQRYERWLFKTRRKVYEAATYEDLLALVSERLFRMRVGDQTIAAIKGKFGRLLSVALETKSLEDAKKLFRWIKNIKQRDSAAQPAGSDVILSNLRPAANKWLQLCDTTGEFVEAFAECGAHVDGEGLEACAKWEDLSLKEIDRATSIEAAYAAWRKTPGMCEVHSSKTARSKFVAQGKLDELAKRMIAQAHRRMLEDPHGALLDLKAIEQYVRPSEVNELHAIENELQYLILALECKLEDKLRVA